MPVVYYLSGLTCTDDNAVQKGGAFKAAAEKGVMFVFPDTSPRGAGVAGEDESWDLGTGAGFYVDAEAALVEALQHVLSSRRSSPRSSSRTFVPPLKSVTGHSMGGLGASPSPSRTPAHTPP